MTTFADIDLILRVEDRATSQLRRLSRRLWIRRHRETTFTAAWIAFAILVLGALHGDWVGAAAVLAVVLTR